MNFENKDDVVFIKGEINEGVIPSGNTTFKILGVAILMAVLSAVFLYGPARIFHKARALLGK